MKAKTTPILEKSCHICKGRGFVCAECHGPISWFGVCTDYLNLLNLFSHSGTVTCPTCQGTGKIKAT